MEEFNYPLNFSDDKYKKCALGIRVENMTDETIIESEEAFMILIKDLNQGDLSNLIAKIKEYFKNELSEEDCYSLTQGKVVGEIEITSELKKKMLDLAYKCLDDGKNLGEASTSDGKFKTSAWISHSLYEARTAEILAKAMGVNSENAKVMGMLHDIGRKSVHTLEHTVKGFEYLIDNGIDSRIATCCLTHSFFNGGRNCYCDPAENGFYLDKDGNECFEGNIEVDDVTDFLRAYGEYNIYDLILNVADLMATDKGIIEPANRIKDIVTRKKPDPKNALYLLSEFTNKMIQFMNKMGISTSIEKLTITDNATLLNQKEKIEEEFSGVSSIFYDNFQKLMAFEMAENFVDKILNDVTGNQKGANNIFNKIKQSMDSNNINLSQLSEESLNNLLTGLQKIHVDNSQRGYYNNYIKTDEYRKSCISYSMLKNISDELERRNQEKKKETIEREGRER